MTIVHSLVLLVCVFILSIGSEAGVVSKELADDVSENQVLDVLFLNGELEEQLLVAAIASDMSEFIRVSFNFQFPDDYSFPELAELQKKAKILVRFNEATSHFTTNNYNGHSSKEIAISRITPRVVLHEFGHALGLAHEHQHPDSYLVKNIEADSICSEYAYSMPRDLDRCQFNILKRYSASEKEITPYDPESVMHYPIPGKFLSTGNSIERNQFLSLGDIQTLSLYYPNRNIGLSTREIRKKWKAFKISTSRFRIESEELENSFEAKLIAIKDDQSEVVLYKANHSLGNQPEAVHFQFERKDMQGRELLHTYYYKSEYIKTTGQHYINTQVWNKSTNEWEHSSHTDPNYGVRFIRNNGRRAMQFEYMVHPNFIKTMAREKKQWEDQFRSLVKVYNIENDYTTYEIMPGDGLFYILHYFEGGDYVIEVKNRGKDFESISYSGYGTCRIGTGNINQNPKKPDSKCRAYLDKFIDRLEGHPVGLPDM